MRSVPPDLHVLVRKTLRALKPYARSEWSANDMDDGLLRPPGGFLTVAVAPEHVDRAGRLLDRVIRLVEGPIAGRVVVEPKKSIFEVGQDRFRFRLKQETTRSDHRPTAAERREMDKHKYVHSVPKWEWRTTDRFLFEVYDPDSSYRARLKLADGKRGLLEQKLEKLPDLVRELIQENRAREAERERLHRQWEEQRRRREEAEEHAARERRAVESLLSEAERWRRANGLRAYVVALEATLRAREVSEDSDAWARVRLGQRAAAELDPLTAPLP
jgi:hypothetical protein